MSKTVGLLAAGAAIGAMLCWGWTTFHVKPDAQVAVVDSVLADTAHRDAVRDSLQAAAEAYERSAAQLEITARVIQSSAARQLAAARDSSLTVAAQRDSAIAAAESYRAWGNTLTLALEDQVQATAFLRQALDSSETEIRSLRATLVDTRNALAKASRGPCQIGTVSAGVTPSGAPGLVFGGSCSAWGLVRAVL